MSKIALITSSTHTAPAGPYVTTWIHDTLKTRPSDDLTIEPLPIADFNLPVYDEPAVPAMVSRYATIYPKHSKK